MFTIIIPVYNESSIIEQNIIKLINYLNNLDYPYEIILANNGSTDSTYKLALSLTKKHKEVKLVSINKRGVGLAFKKAVLASKYNIIISQDMDLSTDLNFIPQSLKLLKNHDVIIGSKRMGSQERSFLRKFISNTYIKLTYLILGLNYKDYSMAAKSYKKDIILNCINNIDYGTGYVLEIIYYAKLNNKRIVEIPVACYDKRKSKFNLFNEIIYRFFILFKIKFHYLTK